MKISYVKFVANINERVNKKYLKKKTVFDRIAFVLHVSHRKFPY